MILQSAVPGFAFSCVTQSARNASRGSVVIVVARLGAGGLCARADLVLDPSSRRVSRAGRELRLTAREFALLEFLLAHKGRSRAYFRELAVAAGVDDPDLISDQWMLLSEGATVTALVEDDRDAAWRARQAAEALLASARSRPRS